MRNVLNLLLLAVVTFGLVACKKDDVKPDDETPTVETPRDTGADTSGAANPNDFSNPDNLDNPESLLSRRVIYFEFDRSAVQSQYRDVVDAHAAYLRSNPGARMTLESHADERGTREYNLGLGERRGNSVEDLLSAQGASGNQVNVVSYGEERPAAMCSEERCWSQNRRVEIVYTKQQ